MVSKSNVTGARAWASLVVLTLAVVLLAIDGTVLALAVPALTADLAPTATEILWIGDIYSFMLAGLLITMGNLADRIGRKKLLLIGSVGFGLASAVAAFAWSPEVLIVARALLGISGATLMPSTLSIVRAIFEDPRQRTRAIAVWSAGATGGAAVGPLVGGALLENFSWGAVFLINIPVVVLIVIAGAILLPESRNPERTPLDWLSAALSILAIVPLVYAVKHTVGSGFDWSSALTFVVGLASGVIFVRRQRRLDTPLIDVSLFRIPAFSGAIAANTVAIFAFSGLLFFFSQYLQLVRGYSPLTAGIAELPSTVAALAVILVVGAIVGRLGAGRAIAAGLAVAALGLLVLAVSEGWETYIGIGVALALVGLGIGVAMTLSTDAVVSAAPKARAGAASSIAETAYELGIALGIAVLGSLQTALYRMNLQVPADLPAGSRDAITESLAAGYSELGTDGPAAAALDQARHAFTTGMQITSVIAAALLAVAVVLAWRVIPSDKPVSSVTHH
jgi:DHA2 family multidrug resistance protein-like MFS transporter